jgi:hypothetical protein
VRIICEGLEGDIKRFIDVLKIEDDLFISVSDIAVEYEKPTGEFRYFEIKRGRADEETAERLNITALHLKNLTSVVSGMNSNLGGKIDNLGDHLGEKIDAGREENRAGFAMVSGKIDSIKEDTGNMSDTLSHLKEIHRETIELREKYEVLSRDVAEIKVKLKAG